MPKIPELGIDTVTPADEARLERKIEKHFNGQRELPSGRDFRWNDFRFRADPADMDERWEKTFPGSPGSKEWWEKKFA